MRMTEDDANRQLEQMVGINRSFQLMRIYQDATMHARDNFFTGEKKEEVAKRIFKNKARSSGYADNEINFYLNHII